MAGFPATFYFNGVYMRQLKNPKFYFNGVYMSQLKNPKEAVQSIAKNLSETGAASLHLFELNQPKELGYIEFAFISRTHSDAPVLPARQDIIGGSNCALSAVNEFLIKTVNASSSNWLSEDEIKFILGSDFVILRIPEKVEKKEQFLFIGDIALLMVFWSDNWAELEEFCQIKLRHTVN